MIGKIERDAAVRDGALNTPRLFELGKLVEEYRLSYQIAREKGRERETRRRRTEVHVLERQLKKEIEAALTKSIDTV